jgi:hypothetical protein
MTFKGAVRWSLRPKRVGVLVAKLLLAGSTDLAAQTTSWKEVNTGVSQASVLAIEEEQVTEACTSSVQQTIQPHLPEAASVAKLSAGNWFQDPSIQPAGHSPWPGSFFVEPLFAHFSRYRVKAYVTPLEGIQ